MTAPDKPCPARVRVEGRWIYCEAGDDGHPGTHVGDKSEHQYRAELRAWKQRTKTTDRRTTT